MIHDDGKQTLPGTIVGKSLRRDDVILDPAQKGKNVVLYVDSDNRIPGAIVNGHWVSVDDSYGPPLELNITLWIKFNEPNQIVLTDFRWASNPKLQTRTTEIRYYNPGDYP